MRILSCAALLLSVCFWAAGCEAATVRFNVRWFGHSPQAVEINAHGAETHLTLDTTNQVFSGSMDVDLSVRQRLFDYVQLVAVYPNSNDPNSNEESLPLRIGGVINRVALRLYHPISLNCDEKTVELAEQKTTNLDEALKRYLIAHDLYYLVGTNACGSYMRRRVTKAWFDRSYNLTRIASFFRLDDSAASAYQQYDSKYVANYVGEAKANELRLANDFKKQLAADKKYKIAAAVNSVILKRATLMGPEFVVKQRLPLSQLRADGRDFLAKAMNLR